jgi:hypothetical protein
VIDATNDNDITIGALIASAANRPSLDAWARLTLEIVSIAGGDRFPASLTVVVP